MSSSCLTTATISKVFAEEVARRSGRVTDTYDDGQRLFTRSVLPQLDDVRPKDRVQGGVALKATSHEICVYPYVFRKVCRNGAIMAHALQGRRLIPSHQDTREDTTSALRETIGACCLEEVFANSVREIRSSLDEEVDLALVMMSSLSRLPQKFSKEVLGPILDRFFGEKDHSRFALMNAVTSAARDRSDPDQRWRLEELGGGIAARIIPKPPVFGSSSGNEKTFWTDSTDCTETSCTEEETTEAFTEPFTCPF